MSVEPDPSNKPEQELSTEELCVRYLETKDQKWKNLIVEKHTRLVRFIAERMCAKLPKSVDSDDLAQEGTFGLMDAIDKFDPSRNIKFKTYCSTRIRGAILDALRSQDWVPRLVRQRATKLDRARQAWITRYGCEPTDAELSKALEVDESDLNVAIKKATPRSILNVSDRKSDPTGAGDVVIGIDTIGEATSSDPAVKVQADDRWRAMVKNLGDKEKSILQGYYQDGLTLREIGERLGITESRVCQIHSNVLKRLRERLEPPAA